MSDVDPLTAAIERARARGHAGAEAAADHADLADPSWTHEAVKFIEVYARTHAYMRCEHVRSFAESSGLRPPPDGRAYGWAMNLARSRGYIEPAGYEAAISSNGSPKVRWKSLIFDGYREYFE